MWSVLPMSNACDEAGHAQQHEDIKDLLSRVVPREMWGMWWWIVPVIQSYVPVCQPCQHCGSCGDQRQQFKDHLVPVLW